MCLSHLPKKNKCAMSKLSQILTEHRATVAGIDDAALLQTFCLGTWHVKPLKAELTRRARDAGVDPNFRSLSIQTLAKLFLALDDIYFNSRLGQKAAVHFKFMRRNANKGGYCERVAPGNYVIAINGHMILRCNSSAKVNGLQCYSRLDMLIEVLLHESLHALIFAYGTGRERAHGKEFTSIGLALFGHLDSKHYITKDTSRMIPKNAAHVGQTVTFKAKKNGQQRGCISSLNLKTATVLTADNKKYLVRYEYLQPAGLSQARI